jgi:succinyl-CoA synthetase beta subunit
MTDNLESDKPDTSNEEVALLAEKKNEDASDKKEQEKENVVIKFLRLNGLVHKLGQGLGLASNAPVF